MSTAAVSAPRRRFDLSWPILIGFAAVLCALIVLPMSWLVFYSFTDKGRFTLENFVKLATGHRLRRSCALAQRLDLPERNLRERECAHVLVRRCRHSVSAPRGAAGTTTPTPSVFYLMGDD